VRSLIGTLRRECLDDGTEFDEDQARRMLTLKGRRHLTAAFQTVGV